MVKYILSLATILLSTANDVQAQSVYQWPAPPAAANYGAGRPFYLPLGTPLRVRTLTQISTKDNKPGDRVYMQVAKSVSFRGQVIIPVGAPVFGEVSEMQRNGHFGKKGKLGLRLIYAETPSGPVRITGESYKEGKSGTVASVATIVLVSWVGFVIHGTSALIRPGTPVDAYLAEPLAFRWYPGDQSQQLGMAAAQPDSSAAAKLSVEP